MKVHSSICIALLIAGLGQAAFAQRITVTSPAGGESWAMGEPVAITWTSSGLGGNVRINLVTRGGALVGTISGSVRASAGRHPWRVGELNSGSVTIGERYRIRIRDVNSDVFDESAVFQIGIRADLSEHPGSMEPAPVLAVTAPRRTDRWCRGQEYRVTWTAGGVSAPAVRIALRQGDREIQVLDDDAPNNGTFLWPIPASLAPGSYAVRVAAPDLTRFDDSDAFEIVSCAPTPPTPGTELTLVERLRITIPAGGENWSAYNEYHIEWESPATSGCGTRVDIIAVAFKGGTERLIARNVLNREGRNYYLWKIGESTFSPGQYKIRLVGSTGCIANSPFFHVAACDFGIENATLGNGRALSSGVTWDPGANLDLQVLVRVTWNRVTPPSNSTRAVHASVRLRGGTERLVGTAAIPLTGFRDGALSLPLRCSIPMGDVAVPLNMRLPLHFKVVCPEDRVAFNNERDVELRLLGHDPTDLAIRIDASGLRITRLYDALPTPSHRFNINAYARNLTPNAAGGTPPPVPRVKCEWRLEERDSDGSWHQSMCNSFYFDSVPFGSELRMNAQYGVWLDEGKDYVLIFEIDPDLEKNDPQRSNNVARVRFHVPD